MIHVADGFEVGVPFISASIISASYGALFSRAGNGGIIFDPDATEILCGWNGDGGTAQRKCANGESGVVGCTCPSYPGDEAHFCHSGYCPFAPADLGEMLQAFKCCPGGEYNEIIVRTGAFRIEAVYGNYAIEGLEGVPRVNLDLSNIEAPFS